MPKPVILVVDDDPEVLRAVVLDLRPRYGRDYRLLPADSGEAALTLLGQLIVREHPVALNISDQRMPRMDGVTYLSRAASSHP